MAIDAGAVALKVVPDTSGFAGQLQAQVSTGLAGVQRRMSSAGALLTKGLTLPLVGAGAAAIKFSTDFGKGMSNVATLIPGNSERVKTLSRDVQDLAVEVGKGTADLTDGLYNVISAFGDTADSTEILRINAKAATAGMAETTDSINLTSAVTKGYGDTSAEAVQKASDLALLTVRLGQTTFPELAGSIGKVIPIAQNLNVTQEEVFATMATFTGVTGSAAEVSTQLRGAMQALMSPTTDAAKAIADAGYESGAALVEQEGLAGAIAFLTNAADEAGVPLQKYIGSVEGQTIALGLAGAQADDYEAKLGEMANAAGATDEAFAEVTDGVGKSAFTFAQLRSRAEVLLQRLGDGLAPALMAVFDVLEPVTENALELATSFANAGPATQKMVVGIAAAVAALGPMLSIGAKLIGVIRGIGAAMAFVAANPIVLIVAGIVALGAALVVAYRQSETFRRLVDTAWRRIQVLARQVWSGIAADIGTAITKARATIVSVMNFVIGFWQRSGQHLINHARNMWGAIQQVVKGALNIIQGIVRVVMGLITGNWRQAWQGIRQIVSGVWNVIQGVVRGAITAVRATIQTILAAIQTYWATRWQLIRTNTGAQLTAIRNAVSDALQRAWQIVQNTLERIRGFFSTIWQRIVTNARGFVVSLVIAIVGMQNTIIRGLTSFRDKMFGIGKSIFTKLAEGIRAAVSAVKNAVGGIVSLFTAGGDGIGAKVSGMLDNARAAYQSTMAGSASASGLLPHMKAAMAIIRSRFPGTRLISGFRPGAITATGNRSYHGMGRAVDLPPNMALFNFLRSTYPNARELIFSPAGARQIHNGRPHVYSGVTRSMHYDHIHLALEQGGLINKAGRFLVGEGTQGEIVNLNRGDMVTPLDRLQNAGAQLPDKITAVFDTGDGLSLSGYIRLVQQRDARATRQRTFAGWS